MHGDVLTQASSWWIHNSSEAGRDQSVEDIWEHILCFPTVEFHIA